MYAKLVASVSLTAGNPTITSAMKDIARIVTSANPSTSLLTAFSQSASTIVDPTPSGWTYVGSNIPADQGSISAGNAPAATSQWNYCFSAPCLNTGLLKYAILNQCNGLNNGDGSGNGFVLTGAQSASSTGVVTNEGGRLSWTYAVYGAIGQNYNGHADALGAAFVPYQSTIFHVIANARHLTIIQENMGIMGIWETSTTNAHTYYNIPPFIQYGHPQSATFSGTNVAVPTGTGSQYSGWATLQTAVAFGTTNIVTPQVNGTIAIASSAGYNTHSLLPYSATSRSNTVDALGNPQYVIGSVYFQDGARGYPTQFVTGTTPIYWTKPYLGNTGDTVIVNSTAYTFFNSGAGYGVLMTTGN